AGRHRVGQRQLDLVVAQVGRRDAARHPARVARHRVGDHVRGLDDAPRLDGDELGVARPHPDAEEPAGGAHSASLASALTAAAAIALPPRRPWTTRYSRPAPFAASASLDSAAPTKPTGTPMIAAAGGAPAKPGEASTSPARSTIPHAWIIRTTARSSTGSKPARSASARMIANDRR